jgi:hypothetical protein
MEVESNEFLIIAAKQITRRWKNEVKRSGVGVKGTGGEW